MYIKLMKCKSNEIMKFLAYFGFGVSKRISKMLPQETKVQNERNNWKNILQLTRLTVKMLVV